MISEEVEDISTLQLKLRLICFQISFVLLNSPASLLNSSYLIELVLLFVTEIETLKSLKTHVFEHKLDKCFFL